MKLHPLASLSVISLMLLLTACSSISKNECLLGDWYSLGVNDGKAGTLATKFRDYQKDCAEHGVKPDFKAYQQGHSQGLVFYCDFPHGEAHGRSGAQYNTACTGKLEADFRRGYQQGQRWHQAKSAVDQLAAAISNIELRIDQSRDEIYRNNQHIAAENDPNRRAALLYRTDRLRDDLERYNAELGRLQVQLYQAQQAFAPLNR
ncbi:DUF2799 domain-containing protein [Rheinheimera sp.]|uniref:DUF2799 domain-containing protein n=1 Tax=Rheinheimera sp. TaxID=1869214 RepID=UPI0027BAAC49|nr:DUF2799 domain-containing protein [Rheinheimera sp.]